MGKGVFKFGAYLLDGEKLTLMREGEMIATHAKVVETLLALVEQHGQVMSKEDLMNRLWPDTFVEEANLKQNIYVLRRTLGEEAGQPRYIETIPKRGYRFIAPVQEVSGERVAHDPTVAPAVPSLNETAPPPRRSQRRRNLFVALAGLILIVAGSWFYFKRSSTPTGLTGKDPILLTDFENKTGDEIFDGTLRQGLAIQLQSAGWLSVFPDEQVRQTLRLMGRSPNDTVTPEIGREICERRNLKALITGSIAALGSRYVITLQALNARNGESLAAQQSEAAGKEQTLRALAEAALRLREQLSAARGQLQSTGGPLNPVTTPKLEALREFTLGGQQAVNGKLPEAIAFMRRAVEIDPSFASAHTFLAIFYYSSNRPETASEYAKKAYDLKAQVHGLEELLITYRYHLLGTGEAFKALEAAQLMKQTATDDHAGAMNLTLVHNLLGQSEQAIAEAREVLRISPRFAPGYWNLGAALLRANRFAEARALGQQAFAQGLDPANLRAVLLQVAYAESDTAAWQQHLAWFKGRPEEYLAFDLQTGAAAQAGRWREAQQWSRQANALSGQDGTPDLPARYAAEQSLRGAALGDCRQARTDAAQALQLMRGRAALPRAALALALCKETKQAQALTDELSRRYAQDTLTQSLWLPVIRAALELQGGDAKQALAQLQATSRYEAAAEFWPQYLRGLAYLQLRQGAEAAAEFQKILDHRGYAPLAPLYPLAHLGLARAAALAGDTTQSRKSYEEFLAVWKEADADLPIARQAKREYEAAAQR